MRMCVLLVVLAGCGADSALCAVERDGVELIRFDGRMEGASCGTYRFVEFINVHLERGGSIWDANMPFDDADAAVNSDLLWRDQGIDCIARGARGTWLRHSGGFDFAIDAQCGGEPIHARFHGSLGQ